MQLPDYRDRPGRGMSGTFILVITVQGSTGSVHEISREQQPTRKSGLQQVTLDIVVVIFTNTAHQDHPGYADAR